MSTTEHALRKVTLDSGEARAAVFTRTYDADVQDVWDACTDPARLARWYQPVQGDLRVGGAFTQGEMGGGRIAVCEAPHLLVLALGGDGSAPAPDQVTLRLTAVEGGTLLELEHATTFETHEIAGGLFDAVYCMGGGYGPRLETLDQHLAGTLPELDVTQLHTRQEYGPFIFGSMGELEKLLADQGRRSVFREMPV